MVSGVMILVPLFTYFLERLSIERARSGALLLNVLPAEVATELKQDRRDPGPPVRGDQCPLRRRGQLHSPIGADGAKSGGGDPR
jgi:hypothetical protein